MLETIWFVLWGLLWSIYFILDGFDLGTGALMPFLAKDEAQKNAAYMAIGPFWDGNEVWLLTAGGVTFAAFPLTYAVMFSSLYSALMLVLFALILRGVSIEFRGARDGAAWRSFWDGALAVGSFLPALLLGVAFANIFKGIPIDGDGVYHGTLLTLLNPYGLAGGALFVCLFLMHGALWLTIKTAGPLQDRAAAVTRGLWPVLLVVAVVFLAMTWFFTDLYGNYLENPVLFIIPGITVVALVAMRLFIAGGAWIKSWIASALTIMGATFFGVTGLYPNMLPSSLDPAFSLTIHNSASTPYTLKIMLVVALIFVPIVICYQSWAYYLFRGKVGD